ncbi:hypothetical protein MUK42_32996 [Musa troglodytarum]|uniref:Uncharacterized protein n=1 Tax=Musa troglodytarum TaxID=320322 RepID=A0A9E7JT32_9LILI|nr:hypothetical protein MUK42_32996 [Musa troglodytarum]
MKASVSDLKKVTGNTLKETAFSSSASQMSLNVDQKFVHGQNAVFRIPADIRQSWTGLQAFNRLAEKADDGSETMDDGLLIPESRRRLILTTQLMHHLIPAVPAKVFKGETTRAYESVAFSIAKSALVDACSLSCSSESDSHLLLQNENMILGKHTTYKVGGDNISKLVEDFIGRSKKLETDLSRLEERISMLDVQLEFQELERFPIVNRLGKFHDRTHAGVEPFCLKLPITKIFHTHALLRFQCMEVLLKGSSASHSRSLINYVFCFFNNL